MTILTASGLAALKKHSAGGGGGGGGTYALVSHATANDSSSATTSGIDTTGSKLIVIVVSWFSGAVTVSDSKGNTYTALTSRIDSSGSYANRIYYCISPTIGTGHTFTVAASFVVFNAMSFSLSSGTPTFDVENGLNHDASTVSSLQPGTVTPAGNNELFITGITWNNPATPPTASINSSFNTPYQSQQGANNLYGGASYKIQTTGAAENPTWSFDNPINDAAATIAVLK